MCIKFHPPILKTKPKPTFRINPNESEREVLVCVVCVRCPWHVPRNTTSIVKKKEKKIWRYTKMSRGRCFGGEPGIYLDLGTQGISFYASLYYPQFKAFAELGMRHNNGVSFNCDGGKKYLFTSKKYS